jgi:hypothetical protein
MQIPFSVQTLPEYQGNPREFGLLWPLWLRVLVINIWRIRAAAKNKPGPAVNK